MQTQRRHSPVSFALSGGFVLALTIFSAATVLGQDKHPVYLPIVAHQTDAAPMPVEAVEPVTTSTPDVRPTSTSVSHEPTSVSHEPTSVPHEPTSVQTPAPTATDLGTVIVPQTATPTATNQPLPKVTPTVPTPTSMPTDQAPIPPYSPPGGLWLSAAEITQLPMSGSAWDNLKAAADEQPGKPDLSDQDSAVNVHILAKALVYARTGEESYRGDVLEAIKTVVNEQSENGGRTLALGRELAAYIIAADLINLQHVNSDLDARFRARLRELLDKPLEGSGSARTLRETHELRPNNWGTHAGASRAAIAVYLGDAEELERTAQVFHGYLGNLAVYDGFKFDSDLSWQANNGRPIGINPAGATKEGHSIDGALPEEMRRGASFQWPPKSTNYPWEGLQGAFLQAEILARAGYPVYEWEDRALLRAVEFLYAIDWPAHGDDEWIPWMVNRIYGTNFPTAIKAQPGKNMGWTDWTHGN